MAEEGAQNIDTIGVGLTLDTSGFDAGLTRARTALSGFETNRSRALKAPQTTTISPQFQVNQRHVRALKTDINDHLSSMAARNEAVAIPVKLGQSDWAGMRSQIADKIGSVPIKVHIASGGVSRGSTGSSGGGGTESKVRGIDALGLANEISAWISKTQGISLQEAQQQMVTAARSRGVTGRARGGPVAPGRTYLVGEEGPEMFRPTQPGRIVPFPRGVPTAQTLSMAASMTRMSGGPAQDKTLNDWLSRMDRESPLSQQRKTAKPGDWWVDHSGHMHDRNTPEGRKAYETDRQLKQRAQGGAAKRGGLPRGYSMEFWGRNGEPGHQLGGGYPVSGWNPQYDRTYALGSSFHQPVSNFTRLDRPTMPPGGAGWPGSFTSVVRHRRSGNIVAFAPFDTEKDPKTGKVMLTPRDTGVREGHRGKGLANAMYVRAEKWSGGTLQPDWSQTEGGEALWAQPNRPFGKGQANKRQIVEREPVTSVNAQGRTVLHLDTKNPQWVSSPLKQRARGGGVRGYGGKYGSSRPATSQSYAEYLDRTWGDANKGDRGYIYTGTNSLDHIRQGGPRGSGVAPVSWWTGPDYIGNRFSGGSYGTSGRSPGLLRTRGGPDPDSASARLDQRVPRRDLQYWGDDRDWHKFRKGRARDKGGMVNQYRIGPTGEWDEARNVGGMQDRVEDAAANYQTHAGPGGYVGIAPTRHGGNVVQLHAADGTIESWRMFGKKRMADGGEVWRNLLSAPSELAEKMGKRAARSYKKRRAGFKRAGIAQRIPFWDEEVENDFSGIWTERDKQELRSSSSHSRGSRAHHRLGEAAQWEDIGAEEHERGKWDVATGGDLYSKMSRLIPREPLMSIKGKLRQISSHRDDLTSNQTVGSDRRDQLRRLGINDEDMDHILDAQISKLLGVNAPKPHISSVHPEYVQILLRDMMSAGYYNQSTAAVWPDVEKALDQLPKEMGPLGRGMPTQPYHYGWDGGQTWAKERETNNRQVKPEKHVWANRQDRFGSSVPFKTEITTNFNDPTEWNEVGYRTTHGMLQGRGNAQGGFIGAAMGGSRSRASVLRDFLGTDVSEQAEPESVFGDDPYWAKFRVGKQTIERWGTNQEHGKWALGIEAKTGIVPQSASRQRKRRGQMALGGFMGAARFGMRSVKNRYPNANVDLSASSRRDRVRMGDELIDLAREYPYMAQSMAEIRSVPDLEMRKQDAKMFNVPLARIMKKSSFGATSNNRNRPKMLLNADYTDEDVRALGAFPQSVVEGLQHEVGHAHDFSLGVVSDRLEMGNIAKLSKYAEGNQREHFAEAFTGYRRGGALDDLSTMVFDLLKKRDQSRVPRAIGGAVAAFAGALPRMGRVLESEKTLMAMRNKQGEVAGPRAIQYVRNLHEKLRGGKGQIGLEAKHLEAGREWYAEAQGWIGEMAEKYGKPVDMVRGMTASLSAGTAWSANKTKVENILKADAAGRAFPYGTTGVMNEKSAFMSGPWSGLAGRMSPETQIKLGIRKRPLDAHVKAKKILDGADPWSLLAHTPKTGAFYRNLGGDLDVTTIDRWALRSATRGWMDKIHKGPQRTKIERAFKRVSKEHGLQPAEFQAAIWMLEKERSFEAKNRPEGRRKMTSDEFNAMRGHFVPVDKEEGFSLGGFMGGASRGTATRAALERSLVAHRMTLENEGGTFAALPGMPVGQPPKGYAVSIPPGGKTAEYVDDPKSFRAFHRAFQSVGALAEKMGAPYVGTWLNKGRIHVDPTIVANSKRDASIVGRKYEQLAAFDLKRFDDVPITGRSRSTMARVQEIVSTGMPTRGNVERVSVETLLGMRREDREAFPRTGQGATDLNVLTANIAEHGFQNPVTIGYNPNFNSAGLHDGNTRLAAALRLGLKSIPAQLRISPSRKRHYLDASLSGEPQDLPRGEFFPPSKVGLRALGGFAGSALHGVKFRLGEMRADLRSRTEDNFERLLDRYPMIGAPIPKGARPVLAPGLPTLGDVGVGDFVPFAHYGDPDYDKLPGSQGYGGLHFRPGQIEFSSLAFGAGSGRGYVKRRGKRPWWASPIGNYQSQSREYFDRNGILIPKPDDTPGWFAPGTNSVESLGTHEFMHAISSYLERSFAVGDPKSIGGQYFDLKHDLKEGSGDHISGYAKQGRINHYFTGAGEEPFAELGSILETKGAQRSHINKSLVSRMESILEGLRGSTLDVPTRGHGGPVWPHASGGRENENGTYLVGELNPELFVPDRMRYIIPEDVMDKIPKRSGGGRAKPAFLGALVGGIARGFMSGLGGAQGIGNLISQAGGMALSSLQGDEGYATGGHIRKMGGGVIEVGGRGPHLFSPPEDGWIIPHNLTGKVSPNIPRAALGTATPPGNRPPSGRKTRKYEPTPAYMEDRFNEMQGMVDEVRTGRVNATGLFSGRTIRSVGASIGANVIGGRTGVFQAQTQVSIAERRFLSHYQKYGTLIEEAANTQVAVNSGSEKNATIMKRYNRDLLPLLKESQNLASAYGEAAKKAKPKLGQVMRSAAATGIGYSAAGMMQQGVSMLMQAAIPQIQKAFDSLTDFAATNQKVTKQIGQSIRQNGGNIEKTMGDLALGSGLSGSAMSFLKDSLSGASFAKAGGSARGEKSDLFRASANVGAPSGLVGGYGGLFGGGLLAEMMGGGKGYAEQIGLDLKDLGNKSKVFTEAQKMGLSPQGTMGRATGGSGIDMDAYMTGLIPSFGAAKAANIERMGGLEGINQTPQRDPKQQAAFEAMNAEILDLNESMARGATAAGQVAYRFSDLEEAAKKAGLTNEEATAKISALGSEAENMAVSGKFFVDAQGRLVTTAKEYEKALAQGARGDTIGTPEAYAASQKLPLQAAFQMAEAQTKHALEISIPAKYGQQLAAQPFLNVRAGISSLGGERGTKMLTQAAATQKALEDEGQAAIKAQVDWIASLDTGDGAMKASSVEYGKLMDDVTESGRLIAGWQTKIANKQLEVSEKSYANNLRLANRAVSDAMGLAGRASGANNLGAVQREQTMLGFGMQQKQINFSVAMAGFQAPGLTSEERGARQEQAKIEAAYAQKQLDLSKQAFRIQAGRGVTDTSAARSVMKAEWDAQKVVAAANRAIAAEQMKMAKNLDKANSHVMKAEGNFSSVLQSAMGYVSVFGSTIGKATTTIREALGMTAVNPRTGKAYQSPGRRSAPGFLGSVTGATEMTVGEAGTETVAVLRNPRSMMMGAMGGGGGGPVSNTITLNLTVQGDVKDEATVAKIVRAVEDSFNRKAARLGMRTYVSATG